jgi:hypothetical protein
MLQYKLLSDHFMKKGYTPIIIKKEHNEKRERLKE